MSKVLGTYKSVNIQLQPKELQSGGWTGDFILYFDGGSTTEGVPYEGKTAYPTREEANRAALESAKEIIENKR